MLLYCHLLSQSSRFYSHNPHFHNIINNGQCNTTLEIAGRSGILHGTCQRIRGLERAWGLHEECVSVAHWWSEAVATSATGKMAVFPHPSYLLDLVSVISCSFQEWNCSNVGIISKMSLIFRNNCPASYNKKSVSVVTRPAMAEMMDLLHDLGRVLFWRGLQCPITSLSIFFVLDSVWKFFDMPSCKAIKYFKGL